MPNKLMLYGFVLLLFLATPIMAYYAGQRSGRQLSDIDTVQRINAENDTKTKQLQKEIADKVKIAAQHQEQSEQLKKNLEVALNTIRNLPNEVKPDEVKAICSVDSSLPKPVIDILLRKFE